MNDRELQDRICSSLDDLRKKQVEFEDVIWKGDNGESIMGRLMRLEEQHKLITKILVGLALMLTPQLLYLLFEGLKAVLKQ